MFIRAPVLLWLSLLYESIFCSAAYGETLRKTTSTHETISAGLILEIRDQYNSPLPQSVISWDSGGEHSRPGVNQDTLAVVDQVNKRFLPDVKIVYAGQRVLFPNSDNIRHHVYSFSKAKTFELKLYSGRPEEPILFDHPGVVVLGCNIHDAMVGYVFVAEFDAVLSDSSGQVHLPTSPASIWLWHPMQENNPETPLHVSLTAEALSTLPQENGAHVLRITTRDPTPRNTFKARFRSD